MTKTVSDFLHFQQQIEKYMSELELENERWGEKESLILYESNLLQVTLIGLEGIQMWTEDKAS